MTTDYGIRHASDGGEELLSASPDGLMDTGI